MQERMLGELKAWTAGGTDREGGGDGPVVVLLHGFGAPGHDLAGLWRVLDVPRETRFVFPEGPLSLDGPGQPAGGRAWWMLNPEVLGAAARGEPPRDRSGDVPQGLGTARALVMGLLDAVAQELGAASDRVLIGGFSQGAMLATDVVLRSDRPFPGLVLLSSTLIAAEEWNPLMPQRRGLPVLQSHGRMDPLLGFEAAEALRDRLREAGLDVQWVPFNGGHEVPGSAVEALSAFVRRTLYAA